MVEFPPASCQNHSSQLVSILRKQAVGRKRSASRPAPLLAVLAAALLVAPPIQAQVPGGIEDLNRQTDLFLRANRIYEFGRDSKDYNEGQRALLTAIPMLREFITTAPQHELTQKASYRLGMAYLLTGGLKEADDTFKYVIQHYRTGHYVATAAYRIAAQRYNEQKWLEAAPWFSMAAREAEKPALRHKASYYDARCLILGKRPDDAIKRLETIILDHGNPYVDYARLAIGQLEAAAGNHEEALVQFEQLLEPTTAPQERAQALLSASESATKLGRIELAEKYLHRLLNSVGLDPKFKTRAQVGLMKARFQDSNYAAVLELMQKGEFAGDAKTQAQVFMLAGRSLAKLGRFQEAPRYFFNVERLAPLSALGFEASYRRLVSFFQVDNPNLAAQCDGFERIYGELFVDHQWLHQAKILKAESLFLQNRITSAATAYSEVDSSKVAEKNRAALLFRRGWCLSESGDYNGATQSLSHFIEKYPDHENFSEALAQRGKAYLELDQLHAASKDFERLLDANPPPALAAFAQQHSARIHRHQREYDQMISRYEALLSDYGTLPEKTIANANYWIGWGWFKLENWKKAIDHLELARTIAPALYESSASTHLILAAYSGKNALRLKDEIARFRKNSPEKQLPRKMLTWLGLQLFRNHDYDGADDYLTLASDYEEPTRTDLIIWRHLAKARLKILHYDRALEAVENVLAREDRDFWKADALLDKSLILIGLKKPDEARDLALEGLALSPKGTVRAGLLMTLGTLAEERADFDSAAANFLKTAEIFVDDTEIKPYALHRAALALDQAQRSDEATQIRAQLKREFPTWSPSEE